MVVYQLLWEQVVMSNKNIKTKVDLSAPAHKKTQGERKAIREKILHERKAAFDMLAKFNDII